MATSVSKLILEADTKGVKPAINQLGKLEHAANDAERATDGLTRSTKRLRDEKGRFVKSTKKATNQQKRFNREVKEGRSRLLGFAAGLVSVGSALAFGGKFVEVNKEFTRMSGMLLTATGSAEAASKQFDKLKEFAATTPFALAQSVDGFVKLKNLGLDPSMESMRSFGNFAAAMGKDLNQMIEAVADASTFEFERLKEFGIKSRQEKDKVSFTFQGVTTEVGKNSAEVVAFLKSIGNEKFGDAMDQQAAVFVGAASNLGDAFDQLFVEAGKGGALDTMTEAFRELATSLSNPESIKGAQAIANMMAQIVSAASGGLSSLLEFTAALSNMAGIKIGEDGVVIIQQDTIEGLSLTEQKIKDAKENVNELETALQKALNIYVAASNRASEGGFLEKFADFSPFHESSAEFVDTLSGSISRLQTRLKEAKQNVTELQDQLAQDQGTVFTSIGDTPLEGSQSAGFDPLTGEAPQMSLATGDQTDPFFADAKTPQQLEAEAREAEIERLKTLETEFQEWKDGLQETELEKRQAAYLAQQEAEEDQLNFLTEQRKKFGDMTLTAEEVSDKMILQGKKRTLSATMNLMSVFAGKNKTLAKALIVAQTGIALADNARTTAVNMMLARQSQLSLPTPDAPARAAAAAAVEKTIGAVNAAAIIASAAGRLSSAGTSSGGGGGSTSAASVSNPALTPVDVEEVAEATQVVNVTVDGSIDPTGARRIIEALNEATEDGLEINALVG